MEGVALHGGGGLGRLAGGFGRSFGSFGSLGMGSLARRPLSSSCSLRLARFVLVSLVCLFLVGARCCFAQSDDSFVAGDTDGRALETGRHAEYRLPASGKVVKVDTRSWMAKILPRHARVDTPEPKAQTVRDFKAEHPDGVFPQRTTATSNDDNETRSMRPLPIGCETVDQMKSNSYTFEGSEREYFVHLPPGYCGSPEAQDDPAVKLPTIVLLHCFGCTPRITYDAFAPIADAWGFALVIPVGTGSPASWNAEVCCGSALANGLNDVGFINHLAMHVPAVHRAISADALFAVGHSNGAMLATLLAVHPPPGGSPFLAVQAWGGTVYDGFNEMGHPLPFMLIHATNDALVSDQGCCNAQACCCDMSSRRGSKPCVSTLDVFTTWGRMGNGCAGHMFDSYARADPTLEELKFELGKKRSIESGETKLHVGETAMRGDQLTARTSSAFRCRSLGNCAYMARDGTKRTEGSGRASVMVDKSRSIHYGGLNNATYCAVDGVGHRFDEAPIFHASRDRQRQRMSYFGAVGDALWYQAFRFLAERSCFVAGGMYDARGGVPPVDKCVCPLKPVPQVPVGLTGWRKEDPDHNFEHVLFTGRWCTERRLMGVGSPSSRKDAIATDATPEQVAANLEVAERLDPGTYGHVRASMARDEQKIGEDGLGGLGKPVNTSRDLAIVIVEVALGFLVSALIVALLFRCTRSGARGSLLSAGRLV